MKKNGGAQRKALEGMGLNVFLTGVGKLLAFVSSATLAPTGFSDASHVLYWLPSSPTLNKTSILCK